MALLPIQLLRVIIAYPGRYFIPGYLLKQNVVKMIIRLKRTSQVCSGRHCRKMDKLNLTNIHHKRSMDNV